MGWNIFATAADKIGAGIKDSFEGAGNGVSKIIDSAKGQIPAEYVGEIEKIKAQAQGEIKTLQIQTTMKVEELKAEAQKTLYDFTLQYEGTASQVPAWVLIMRSIIRPVITICMFFSLMFFIGFDIYGIWTGSDKLILTELPQAYYVILGIILGFWFGGKAGENIADKIKKK